MLAVNQSIKTLPTFWPTALFPIHHSTISLHHAKEGYDYPTIRLPHTFSKIAGLPTRIYQTVHNGALAFLVVLSPDCTPAANRSEKIVKTSSGKPESSVFTQQN